MCAGGCLGARMYIHDSGDLDRGAADQFHILCAYTHARTHTHTHVGTHTPARVPPHVRAHTRVHAPSRMQAVLYHVPVCVLLCVCVCMSQVEFVTYASLSACDEVVEVMEAVGASERVLRLLESPPAAQVGADTHTHTRTLTHARARARRGSLACLCWLILVFRCLAALRCLVSVT